MSVSSRSSSISSNKRRIDEIDDTIEYLTNEIHKCDNFALKSDFESSLLALKLRREKVKALAAAARTQVLLADMEVLIAESDLLSDVERLKKYKRIKLDGGKDEPQASQQESRKRTMKSTSVQTSTSYRTDYERKKRKHSESKHSSKHTDRETIRSQSISKSPTVNCQNNLMEPLKSPQASHKESSQITTKSISAQTSPDRESEHQPKKMKYSDSRCSPTHPDSGTIQSQPVLKSPNVENISGTSPKDKPTESFVLTQANGQDCTPIPESTSTQTSSEPEHDFTTSKPIDAIHSPMHIDIDTLVPLSVYKSPTTEKEPNVNRKYVPMTPLEKAYRSERENEYNNWKPSESKRTPTPSTDWDSDTIELPSLLKSPTATNNSEASTEDSLVAPLKVITGYTSDIDISLSSPLKAEFAKPYPIKQSQDIRKLQMDSSDSSKDTSAPQLKEKKKKKPRNKKNQENPVPQTKPAVQIKPAGQTKPAAQTKSTAQKKSTAQTKQTGIKTKTVTEINRSAFSPKPSPHNIVTSYNSQNAIPCTSKTPTSWRAPIKHKLPLMVPQPIPLSQCLIGQLVPQTTLFESTTGLRSPYNFYNKNN